MFNTIHMFLSIPVYKGVEGIKVVVKSIYVFLYLLGWYINMDGLTLSKNKSEKLITKCDVITLQIWWENVMYYRNL